MTARALPGGRSARLRELSELRPGWHDGAGEEPTQQVLRWAGTLLAECHNAGVAQPGIYPTECGSVLLEWVAEDREVTALVKDGRRVDLLAFSKLDDLDEEEQSFAWSEVSEVVSFIRGRLQKEPGR